MFGNNIARVYNFLILSVLLPVVYGCKAGGGDGSGSAASLGLDTLLGQGQHIGSASGQQITADGGVFLPTIHNPEPATILLMGSGLAAMGLYKKRKSSSQ